MEFLGESHPVFVQFPIALAVAAAFAEVLVLITRRAMFTHAARYSIVVAALGALAAMPSGWIAGGGEHGELTGLVTTHRWLGVAAGVIIIGTAILSEASHRSEKRGLRLWYRVALFAGTIVVLLAGYFGGKIVYG